MNAAETMIYKMTGWDGMTEEFDSFFDAMHRAAVYLGGWMNDGDELRYFWESHDDCVVVVVTGSGEDTDAQCLIKRVRETGQ